MEDYKIGWRGIVSGLALLALLALIPIIEGRANVIL